MTRCSPDAAGAIATDYSRHWVGAVHAQHGGAGCCVARHVAAADDGVAGCGQAGDWVGRGADERRRVRAQLQLRSISRRAKIIIGVAASYDGPSIAKQ